MEPKDRPADVTLLYVLLTTPGMVLYNEVQEQCSSDVSSNRQNRLAGNHEEGLWEKVVAG